eukprot:5664720-Prymnesium_polylepis.1
MGPHPLCPGTSWEGLDPTNVTCAGGAAARAAGRAAEHAPRRRKSSTHRKTTDKRSHRNVPLRCLHSMIRACTLLRFHLTAKICSERLRMRV